MAGHASNVSALLPFLSAADLGLQGALACCLAAPEIRQLVQTCSQAHTTLASPLVGCCCPHLRPRTGQALAAALLGCCAPQVRSLCPVGDLECGTFLPELTLRLPNLGHLEELGPLCIDTSCGPLLLPAGSRERLLCPAESSLPASDHDTDETTEGEGGLGDQEQLQRHVLQRLLQQQHHQELQQLQRLQLQLVSARSLLPALAEGFKRCRHLAELDLTVRCEELACARTLAEVLLPALGSCGSLRALRLDLDACLQCGRLLMAGVARFLQQAAASTAGVLRHLSLGYLWWSETSEQNLRAIRAALKAMSSRSCGGVRELVVRYPQDEALGAVEAVCAAVEGVAIDVEQVCLVDGWGEGGGGFAALAEALATCSQLSRVDILGSLPGAVDLEVFAAKMKETRPHAAIHFNAAEGWLRAAQASPSASDRERLRQQSSL